ncbi:MAG: LysR family transcriptional regulator [Thermoplasmata archaeon]|jgi:DNA-binding transcriptional LysR family regulator|nr:LysR family transcriptional regulator [Thermoplasmata archaeon]
MPLTPRVVFVSEGHEITRRQLEAIAALHGTGTMTKAARALGVSTPVLYKYVKEAEEKAGVSLVNSTSRGSRLTADGLDLLHMFRACELRLSDEAPLKVAGTLVSERCVLTAATALSEKGLQCRVSISDDEANLRAMDEMRVDCVVLDDAMYAMERAPEAPGSEISSDVLLHRDAGCCYDRLAFGAQRLGFRQLEQRGTGYEVARTVWEPALLDSTDHSYFVNKSLVRRGVVKASGAKEQRWSVHSIIALECSRHPDLPAFMAEARRVGLYPKG